jgi:CRP/FNR family cyclic AMP-dependent transcriptional regulator
MSFTPEGGPGELVSVRGGRAVVRRYPQPVTDKLAILRGVPLFADLDETSLQAVAVLAREQTHKAGDVLMLEGEPGDEFYVIVEGTIRIERGDRTIRSMTPGGFLGEIALFERRPRTATATAESDVQLLVLRQHEFDRLLDTMPAVYRRIRATIDRRERGRDWEAI